MQSLCRAYRAQHCLEGGPSTEFVHPGARKLLTPTNVLVGDIHTWSHRSGLQWVFSVLLTGGKALL